MTVVGYILDSDGIVNGATNGNGHRTPIRLAPARVAIYARVSTSDQTPENQLALLRAYAEARGWPVTEFVDHGISGAKDRRPALDAMMAAVRARRVDVVAITKLDRLARSTRHLVTLAGELEALGVDLIALDQAIDTTTPAGRLLFNVLAAIAEFERDLIRDRVLAGMRRARAQGRHLGRPRRHHVDVDRARDLLARGASLRAAARTLGVPHVAVSRALAAANGVEQTGVGERRGSLRRGVGVEGRGGGGPKEMLWDACQASPPRGRPARMQPPRPRYAVPRAE